MAARTTAAKKAAPAATKKAATPAKKAAPAAKRMPAAKSAAATPASSARSTRSKAKPIEDAEPDLLAGLGDEDSPAEDDNEEFDLLDGITEDQGDAWNPADDEDVPEGIQGRILSITYIDTDYGNKEPVPMLEIEESDGHIWSVRGYHTVLRNQIEKNDPEVGDLVAIKYLGEKDNKKGDNSYQNYGMNCPACTKRKRGK